MQGAVIECVKAAGLTAVEKSIQALQTGGIEAVASGGIKKQLQILSQVGQRGIGSLELVKHAIEFLVEWGTYVQRTRAQNLHVKDATDAPA